MNVPPAKNLLTLAALSAVYVVAAKFGLTFAFVNDSASAIWPASGIALAAVLILGYRVWPALFIGAFLANLTQGSVAAAIAIGIGNTLEGLVGAALVNHLASGSQFVTRPRHILVFAGLAAALSTAVGAGIGVSSLVLSGLANQADAAPIWLTWWMGDLAGDLVVAPVIVLWCRSSRLDLGFERSIEAGALVLSLSVVAYTVFHGAWPNAGAGHLSLEFLCVPFLFWAAFRFGRRAVATCVLIESWIAIWGTLRGFGPLATSSPNGSLLLLQAHLAVQAVTMLAVGAVVWQLRAAERHARELAVTDSLTGLANYRRLMTVLGNEIKRSQRTNRPLAVLLLDMDGLKRVNDDHGHLAGNRALCRVADALRASVRTTDTVVRFGGDEFACVLPETSDAGAEDLATRLGDQLVSDVEQPQLSASLGWAVYPRDGETAEMLLSVADRALYAAKAPQQVQSGVPSRRVPEAWRRGAIAAN